ncbi:MAG: MarR family transcriptional regulator [Succinivibrionaceae bacterium]|nr:MarR family transcriptional regulator [Succinivibrionaceae bacterium]
MLYLVSRVHELGNDYIANELKKRGAEELAPSHGDILFCLHQKGQLTMKEIAEMIHRTRPTVTALVSKLEKLDYVRRKASPTDGRSAIVELTEKGSAFMPAFEEISEGLNQMLYANLTDGEARQLESLLEKALK